MKKHIQEDLTIKDILAIFGTSTIMVIIIYCISHFIVIPAYDYLHKDYIKRTDFDRLDDRINFLEQDLAKFLVKYCDKGK